VQTSGGVIVDASVFSRVFLGLLTYRKSLKKTGLPSLEIIEESSVVKEVKRWWRRKKNGKRMKTRKTRRKNGSL